MEIEIDSVYSVKFTKYGKKKNCIDIYILSPEILLAIKFTK